MPSVAIRALRVQELLLSRRSESTCRKKIIRWLMPCLSSLLKETNWNISSGKCWASTLLRFGIVLASCVQTALPVRAAGGQGTCIVAYFFANAQAAAYNLVMDKRFIGHRGVAQDHTVPDHRALTDVCSTFQIYIWTELGVRPDADLRIDAHGRRNMHRRWQFAQDVRIAPFAQDAL